MINRKPCFLAGVCCFFFTLVHAQADWPNREWISDTSNRWLQPYEELNNHAPAIYYRDKPAVLVYIDGEPIITVDEVLRMYRVLNTPHLIIKNHHDNRYYLYWDTFWYVSDSATSGYMPVKIYPAVIKLIDSLVKLPAKTASKKKPVLRGKLLSAQSGFPRPQVIVTLQPSELIQTKGIPVYMPIPGTSLKYVSNTSDYILLDTTDRRLYTLLSGRWYRADSLQGDWTYRPADSLPGDFRKIPAGSARADVLVHVAKSDSANRALAIARGLYITRVSRQVAPPEIIYDGGAEFSSVSNTGLFVSENSNVLVVNVKDRYYALLNGVWFVSNEAIGSPWQVSTERPPDIDKLPPSHRGYYARFVYITDTTADYIYTGYTSGYINSYIQAGTIVWGSGWPYRSWIRKNYYQQPGTWGRSMKYSFDKGWTSRYTQVLYTPRN